MNSNDAQLMSLLRRMPCVPTAEERTRNAAFNPSHIQYACCFQHLHANTGSFFIAIFHILISTAVLAWVVRMLLTGNKSHLEGCFELLLAGVCLVSSLILVVGMRMENRRMVSCYIMCQVVITSLLFVLFLALIMGLKAGVLDDPNHDGYNTLEEEMLIVVEIFASLAVVALEVWFLTIVLKTYRFLSDKYHYTGAEEQDV